jgi:DNA polymerase elongation subunit (family B)
MILSTFSKSDYHIVCDNKGYVVSPIAVSAEAIVRDIILLGSGMVDVYDIETECGNFMAGLGTLIVKNTDSIYCHFRNGTTASEVWRQAKMIEKQFLTLFPPPMKLVFEEKLYKVFLILTKKRYMAYTCDDKGVMDEKLTIRGVLLARRDNCRWIREVYETVVRMIMENCSWSVVEDRLLDMCKELFYRQIGISRFIITKAVGKDYKIRPLPADPKKCQKRLMDLDILPPKTIDIDKMNQLLAQEGKESKKPCWLSEYVLRSKPAHIQLAEKMARRGHPVEVGSRLEFVIVEHPNPKAKQFEKIEDPAYCKRHGDLVRIDPYYYLQALAKPLDQLFETVFHKKNYTYQLYKLHYQWNKVQEEIYYRDVILRFPDS